MNKRFISLILLSFVLGISFSSVAQLDSRGRNAETIITDGLAQLPAKNPASYNEVIGEMAATGQKGIEMLAGMLKPADKNQNALFEYAIDAIVSYVSRADNAAMQQSAHDGLVAGLKKCGDDPNRAFLMTQHAPAMQNFLPHISVIRISVTMLSTVSLSSPVMMPWSAV